jgi:hypothetical protein
MIPPARQSGIQGRNYTSLSRRLRSTPTDPAAADAMINARLSG